MPYNNFVYILEQYEVNNLVECWTAKCWTAKCVYADLETANKFKLIAITNTNNKVVNIVKVPIYIPSVNK